MLPLFDFIELHGADCKRGLAKSNSVDGRLM
jgi:hypothetical protein